MIVTFLGVPLTLVDVGSEKIHHEMPDVSTVKSKLDDKNPDYKPPTSQRKIETRKLVWKAESKVENKNMDYRRKSMGISQEDGIDKKPKVKP